MSNLIITIVAIALAAVILLIGLWYGGDAFGRSNATAIATTYEKQAQQISAAMQVWSVNNAGSQTLPATNWTPTNGPSFLLSDYLNQFPTPPSSTTSTSLAVYNWSPANYQNLSGSFSGGFHRPTGTNGPYIYLTIYMNASALAEKVCLIIAAKAGLSSIQRVTATNATRYAALPEPNPMNCFWTDANNNSIVDSGDTLQIFYKFF